MRDALSKFCLGIIVEGGPRPFGIEGRKKKGEEGKKKYHGYDGSLE